MSQASGTYLSSPRRWLAALATLTVLNGCVLEGASEPGEYDEEELELSGSEQALTTVPLFPSTPIAQATVESTYQRFRVIVVSATGAQSAFHVCGSMPAVMSDAACISSKPFSGRLAMCTSATVWKPPTIPHGEMSRL